MWRPLDTSADAARRQTAAYRAMSPSDRVRIAATMSDEVRVITAAGIRRRHPEWSDEQCAAELARIVLGDV